MKPLRQHQFSKSIINNKLPNRQQRQDLCELISNAFTDIRYYAWNGRNKQAAKLADIFHNIPQEMYGYGLWDLTSFIESLQLYQDKYGGRNYVSNLNKIFDKG
jgi:hypothetical protein